MAGTIVVMILEQDDPNRGEIKFLSDSSEAARLAEGLIESGIETERIRIFDASELAMKVAHRPVVSLGADENDYASAPVLDEEHEPVAVLAGGADDELPSQDAQSFSEEPLMRNGVKFSSLFKSDDV
jgi:hypothetical protein